MGAAAAAAAATTAAAAAAVSLVILLTLKVFDLKNSGAFGFRSRRFMWG